MHSPIFYFKCALGRKAVPDWFLSFEWWQHSDEPVTSLFSSYSKDCFTERSEAFNLSYIPEVNSAFLEQTQKPLEKQ